MATLWQFGGQRLASLADLQSVFGAGADYFDPDPLDDGGLGVGINSTGASLPVNLSGDTYAFHFGAQYIGSPLNVEGGVVGVDVAGSFGDRVPNLRERQGRFRLRVGSTVIHSRPADELLTGAHWVLEVREHATAGYVRLFRNGTLLYEDTDRDTTPNTAGPRFLRLGGGSTDTGSRRVRYSHLVLATENLGELVRVRQLVPSTDEGPNDFTRSDTGRDHYEHINESPHLGDGRFLESEDFGDSTRHGMSLGLTGVEVLSVQPIAIARIDGSGANDLEVEIESGASASGNLPLGTVVGSSYGMIQGPILNQNPATSAPWTLSALEALRMRFEHVDGST